MSTSIEHQGQTTPLAGEKQVQTTQHVKRVSQVYALRTTLAEMWSVVILPFLVIRLALVLVGVVTIYYILPLINPKQPIYPDPRITHFPDMLWLMWDHFDAGFYMSIAHGGYWNAASLNGMSNWAFFPLYPVLIRLLDLPFGISDDGLRISGIIVASIATIVAGIYLYKLTALELNKNIAARAVLYVFLFPTSFYFSSIYPESLFLALSIGCLYYARRRNWWLSGLLGGFAALTRPQGVFLVLIVAWEYWQALADQYAPLQERQGIVAKVQEWFRSRFVGLWLSLKAWRTWVGIVALLQIPVGLGIFCVYGKIQVGNFLAFQEVEHNGWGRSFSNPLILILHMLHHPRPTSPYDWNFYALNMTVILIFLLLIIPIFRKLPALYGIFTLVFVIMPLTVGETNSVARYYLGIFPVFMLLAWWASQGQPEQQERRHSLIVATFAILLALGMTMFTLGVYSMA